MGCCDRRTYIPQKYIINCVAAKVIENYSTEIRKQKKRTKSSSRFKTKRKSLKRHKNLSVESVYSNQSMVKQGSEMCQLEACGQPVNVSQSTTKAKRTVIDYMQHVSSKAPCAPKALQRMATSNKPNALERSRQYMAQLADKKLSIDSPEYLEQNKLIIQRFHEQQTSLYTQKLTSGKAVLSSSTECVVFRPPPSVRPVQQFSVLRQTLGSAPLENTASQHHKTVKIYLSDKQSVDMSEFGYDFPCPPPPSPAEGL